jgi:hypothetical protein
VRRGIVPVKPLGLGDVLEGAFRAIRHNPRVMIGLTLLVVIVTTAVSVLPVSLGFSVLLPLSEPDAAAPVDLDPARTGAALVGVVAALLVTWLGGVVATGMLTVSVGESIVDRRIGLAEAWRRVRGRILPLALQGLLVAVVLVGSVTVAVTLAVLLGVTVSLAAGDAAGVILGVLLSLAAVAAAVWLGIRWSLAPVPLVLERAPVIRSLGRSSRLVRGTFWRTLGILVLANLLITVIAQIVTAPVGIAGGIVPALAPGNDTVAVASLAVTYAASSLISVVVYPFLAAVVTLLYIDRRIRTEGLDIALTRSLAERS